MASWRDRIIHVAQMGERLGEFAIWIAFSTVLLAVSVAFSIFLVRSALKFPI